MADDKGKDKDTGPNLDKDKAKDFEKGFREATGAPPKDSPSPGPSPSKDKPPNR